jgi:hypothetical protein
LDDDERKPKPNIPEDVLNLELKFLDENVRPYITEVVDSWRKYMKKGTGAKNIVINIQALLWQLRPVDRLTQHELELFEDRNKKLINNGKEFEHDIVVLINDLTEKIGDCKLFSRPSEETSSGLGTLMRQMKKEKVKKDGV